MMDKYIDLVLSTLVEMGEESIIYRAFDPYKNYMKGKFPSGKVEKNYFYRAEISYRWKFNYSISLVVQRDQNFNSIYFKLNVPIFQSLQKKL